MTQKNKFIWLAMFCVYLFWGGTYLGMKIAIESMPPFLMAGVRFLLAGVLLYIVSRTSGAKRPPLREWVGTAPIGILLLVGGNGGIAWAEQHVPSSLAALLVATMPFWISLFNWLIWKGKRPNRYVVLGLIMGFAGIVWMVMASKQSTESGTVSNLIGPLVCLLAAISWSFGSTWSRFVSKPSSPMMYTAVQMLTGGTVLSLIALFSGDFQRFEWSSMTMRTWFAFGYLVLFGSFVAYNAYVWLLQNADLAMVSTYTYVNPVVAMLLGWAIGGEILHPAMLGAAAVILCAVVLITRMKDWVPKSTNASSP